MQPLTPSQRCAVVEHVVIQAMQKAITRGQRAIGPTLSAPRLQKLPPPCQRGTDVVHRTLLGIESGGHRRHRAYHPCYARCFQHLLLRGAEALKLLLDQASQTVGHIEGDFCASGHDPVPLDLPHRPLS
jgi:hypothetical protein